MKLALAFHATAAVGWTCVGLDGIVNRDLARSIPMLFFMSAYAIVGFHVVALTQNRQPVQIKNTLVENTTIEETST